VIAPQLIQGYSFCPITATLQDPVNGQIYTSLISFDQTTGVMTFNSDDKTMHGLSLSLTLQISASLNSNAAASTIDIIVNVVDECHQSSPSAAIAQSKETSLFAETFLGFLPAQNAKNCGMISNELVFANADGNDPSITLFTQTPNTIRIYGDDAVEHVGNHYVRIKSCISVYENGLPIICDNCCSFSQVFIITLFDPCPDAILETFKVPNTLMAQQVGEATLDLKETSNWPWTDKVEVAGYIMEGMCGSFSVTLTVTSTGEPAQYIEFN